MWSIVGWEILENLKRLDDKTMVLVDDLHTISDMSAEERDLPSVEFALHSDYLIMESAVHAEAINVLSNLQKLPKKKRARLGHDGKWFVSGFLLTDEKEKPLCVLLDAGLTLRKRDLGFQEGINILPYFYEKEQVRLLRIIAKAIPDFHLRTILYKLNGEFWELGRG